MNDVNLAPENKEATPEHGYLMAYDKKEQKAKGVKGIAANGELETLEANEANRDQFIKVDQRGNFFTNFGKNFLYQYNNPGRYSLYNMPKETPVEHHCVEVNKAAIALPTANIKTSIAFAPVFRFCHSNTVSTIYKAVPTIKAVTE